MCSEVAIAIRDLSKRYRVYNSPYRRLMETIFPGRTSQAREVWAIRDVSFDIGRGETVGIIGRNGSGKSTLLGIISDTLSETDGEVTVNGRVSALLELGAGFNPEFTGRENVFMNGVIMGLSRTQIQKKYDDIAAFAEIGDFIDQPVKTYSSGMYVRLAFAVAVNLEPDIFIVDEALAVGDVRFQNKCFRKFKELQETGATVLFVTHSTEAVVKHCHSAILLEEGRLVAMGEPRAVVNKYLDMLFGQDKAQIEGPGARESAAEATQSGSGVPKEILSSFSANNGMNGCEDRKTYNPSEYRWGDGRASISDYAIKTGKGIDPVVVYCNEALEIYVKTVFRERIEHPIYGMTIKTADGVTVYGTNSREKGVETGCRESGSCVFVCYRFRARLLMGDYFISLGVAEDDPVRDNIPLDRRYDVIHLRIEGEEGAFGLVDLGAEVEEL